MVDKDLVLGPGGHSAWSRGPDGWKESRQSWLVWEREEGGEQGSERHERKAGGEKRRWRRCRGKEDGLGEARKDGIGEEKMSEGGGWEEKWGGRRGSSFHLSPQEVCGLNASLTILSQAAGVWVCAEHTAAWSAGEFNFLSFSPHVWHLKVLGQNFKNF